MNVWQYLQPLDLNEASQRFLHAQPFPHICFDNFLIEEFAHEVEQSFPGLSTGDPYGSRIRRRQRTWQGSDYRLEFVPTGRFTSCTRCWPVPSFCRSCQGSREFPS